MTIAHVHCVLAVQALLMVYIIIRILYMFAYIHVFIVGLQRWRPLYLNIDIYFPV